MRDLYSKHTLLPGLFLAIAAGLPAQDPPTGKGSETMRQQLEQLRAEQDQALQDFDRRLSEMAGHSAGDAAGTSRFLITGYGFTGFTNREDENSSFSTHFSPIFLWKLRDDVLFEAELNFELEGDETHVDLEYAQLSFVVNDLMTIGLGKFLNPGNYFMERLHPAWINKLPDRPMAFGHDGLIASSHLGVQVHGAVPMGERKLEYSAWLANGASLETDDPDEAGQLRYNNYDDTNNSKSAGARVGFFVLPELEIGYSIDVGRVNATGSTSESIDAIVQSIDLSWTGDCELLGGSFDLRGQWVQSRVDTTTYDPSGAFGFGPLTYENDRDGGYLQAAFRPTTIEGLKDFEGVVRFDAIDMPNGAPMPVDRQRVTVGLNYWFDPSTVLKIAYQFDDKDDPTGAARDQNAVFMQMAIGF